MARWKSEQNATADGAKSANPNLTAIRVFCVVLSIAGVVVVEPVLGTEAFAEPVDGLSNLLLLIGVVNLLYGSFSLPLARRRQRPLVLIQLLAVANLAWALFFCFRWAYVYGDTASLFGLAHFVGEGIWVGGLGVLEWRWRESLQTA